MSCRYIRRSEGGYALAFFTTHLLLYLTLRLVSLLIPEEMQLFVFMFSLFASFGLISFLHDHVMRYFGIFLLYEWSTAGFEPASSACKADVLPNKLRPHSCRDRNRTDMKRHVTTPLSRSATLQYVIIQHLGKMIWKETGSLLAESFLIVFPRRTRREAPRNAYSTECKSFGTRGAE